MDPLIEASVKGLVFDGEGYCDLGLDFVLHNSDRIFIVYADWWLYEWGPFNYMFPLAGKLVREDDVWALGGRSDGKTARISPPEYPDSQVAFFVKNACGRRDRERGPYINACNRLGELLGNDFDIQPWIDAISVRPQIDAVAELSAWLARPRSVGIVVLIGRAGKVVDALAMDEDRNCAVANTNWWLAQMGGAWNTRRDELPLESYVEWMSGLQPNQPFDVVSRGVSEQAGNLEDIARAALRS